LSLLLELLARLCTGAFIGFGRIEALRLAAFYVSLVEDPIRVECGPALALKEFRPRYRRGALTQATLAAVGCLAVGAWLAGRERAVMLARGLAFRLLALEVIRPR